MTFDEIKELENIIVVEDNVLFLHVDSVEGYSMKHNNVYSKCIFIPKLEEEVSLLEVVKDEDIVPVTNTKFVENSEEPELLTKE